MKCFLLIHNYTCMHSHKLIRNNEGKGHARKHVKTQCQCPVAVYVATVYSTMAPQISIIVALIECYYS